MANNTNTQRLRIIKPETLKPVGSAQMQKEILALQKQLRQKNKELDTLVNMIDQMMKSKHSLREKLSDMYKDQQALLTVLEKNSKTQLLQAETISTLISKYVVTEHTNSLSKV